MIKSEMLNDVDRFLTCSNYSPATTAAYAYHLKRLADWLEACGLDFTALNAMLLRAYVDSHGWKNNTRRAAGSAAKAYLKWRYGELHPALELKLPKDNSAPGRCLEQEEVDRLLASFDTTKPAGWRDLSMIAVMVESGIRASEVCRLDLEYLDLERQHFDVLAKGQKWREGIFSRLTAYYLDIWLNSRKEIACKNCKNVFVSVNGKTKGRGFTPGGLRAIFRKIGIRAGIGKISPHMLRRTMATLLIENGAPTRLVQELGQWDDIRMVERYTRSLKPSQIERYSPILRNQRVT